MRGPLPNEVIVPILNDEYYVVVCWGNAKEVEKILKRWYYTNYENPDMDTRGLCFWNTGCFPVIALPRKPKTSEELATLAHEACHAVENIFDKIGEPIGGEIFAHSVGSVVRITMEQIKVRKL
jgi:hypothetical protein